MSLQDTDAAEVPRVTDVRGWNDTRKGDRSRRVESEPPMTLLEFRNGSAVEESQAMKLCQGVCNIVVLTVDLANPIHQTDLQSPGFVLC